MTLYEHGFAPRIGTEQHPHDWNVLGDCCGRIRNTLSSIITREYKDGVYDRAVVTISQLKTT